MEVIFETFGLGLVTQIKTSREEAVDVEQVLVRRLVPQVLAEADFRGQVPVVWEMVVELCRPHLYIDV